MEERENKESPLGLAGEWSEVISKKTKRLRQRQWKIDIASNGKWSNQRDITSFYFSAFPDTHGAKEMLKAFSYYGDAIEVVIPPKKDKQGRRFGFVRFRNILDTRLFANKLDNIIIGSDKIHVNIPRFNRDWEEHKPKALAAFQRETYVAPKAEQVWRRKENKGGKTVYERRGELGPGKKKQYHQYISNPLPPKIIYHRKIDLSELCFNVEEDKMVKFSQMYVGVVKKPGNTYVIQDWLCSNGVLSVKATPLGANKVLLEETEEGKIQALIVESGDLLREMFEDVRRWNPKEADNERVVWLRCHGVPIHAWSEEFFCVFGSEVRSIPGC